MSPFHIKECLSCFGFYIETVGTNGKLFVFLSLFYGQFVLVVKEKRITIWNEPDIEFAGYPVIGYFYVCLP